MTARRRRTALTVVGEATGDQRCEVCGSAGPLALQQVGDDPAAVFLLCAPCGAPAADRGIARWLPMTGT